MKSTIKEKSTGDSEELEIEEEPGQECEGEYHSSDADFTTSILDRSGSTLQDCIQCGTCTGSCPSGQHTAMRIRRLLRGAQLGLRAILDDDDLWLCTTCYTCYERCPNRVEAARIVMILRNMAAEKGLIAEKHRLAAKQLAETGHLVPLNDEIAEVREKLGLSRCPPTAQFSPELVQLIWTLLHETGFDTLYTPK